MSTSQKQIGDRVRITAGQNKNSIGTLADKVRRGWVVELEDGQKVIIPFPQVQLLQEDDNQSPSTVEPVNTSKAEIERSEINADGEVTVHFSIDDINRPKTPSETPVSTEQTVSSEDGETQSNEETDTPTESEPAHADTDDISKLNVKGLQRLAKQRGISIARTKDDFLKIIEEKNPDEDLERLKGKVLFDRVTDLHISRLRTKQDLLNLLSA